MTLIEHVITELLRKGASPGHIDSWTPSEIEDGKSICKSTWWNFANKESFMMTAEYFLCGEDGDSDAAAISNPIRTESQEVESMVTPSTHFFSEILDGR